MHRARGPRDFKSAEFLRRYRNASFSSGQVRVDILDQNLALMLAHRHKVQPAIVCSCFWSEMERGTSRADVHCAPKDVATGNIFSIDAHGPVARRIIERQLAKKR